MNVVTNGVSVFVLVISGGFGGGCVTLTFFCLRPFDPSAFVLLIVRLGGFRAAQAFKNPVWQGEVQVWGVCEDRTGCAGLRRHWSIVNYVAPFAALRALRAPGAVQFVKEKLELAPCQLIKKFHLS